MPKQPCKSKAKSSNVSGTTNNKAFFAKKKRERERLLVEKGAKNNYAIVGIETPDQPILDISATKPADSYTSITHPATQLEGDKQQSEKIDSKIESKIES